MKDTLHRIWSLIVKEFLQMSRDKVLVAFIILGPLLELALMGNLVGGGIRNLPLAAIDLDRSQASHALVDQMDRTDEFLLQAYGDDVAQAHEWIQTGQVAAVLVVPPHYGERLADPRQSAEVQIIVDDSNYVVEIVATATAESVAAEIARDLAARHAVASAGALDLRVSALFNGDLDGRPLAITSLLGLIVYQVTLVIAAQTFTRERELGTLEQLRITPLSRIELLVGKALPTLLIGLVDALLMVGVVAVWFQVPVRGSLLLLLLLTVPFVLVQIGWGTLISLVSRTQQQAVLFVFAVAMLEVACSGFIVPASDMPQVMRVISYASSVQHYLVILRGVLLRGAGFSSLWLPALSMAVIAAAAVGLAWLRLWLGLDTDSLAQRLRAVWTVLAQRRTERQATRQLEKTQRARPQLCPARHKRAIGEDAA